MVEVNKDIERVLAWEQTALQRQKEVKSCADLEACSTLWNWETDAGVNRGGSACLMTLLSLGSRRGGLC